VFSLFREQGRGPYQTLFILILTATVFITFYYYSSNRYLPYSASKGKKPSVASSNSRIPRAPSTERGYCRISGVTSRVWVYACVCLPSSRECVCVSSLHALFEFVYVAVRGMCLCSGERLLILLLHAGVSSPASQRSPAPVAIILLIILIS
jgi:hypothetical protein